MGCLNSVAMPKLFPCLALIAGILLPREGGGSESELEGLAPESKLKITLESDLDTMTPEKRHRLQCYLRYRFLKASGGFKHCCLPNATRNSTCAIVSSSGALLKRNYAKEIDAHPFVVRFNDAPVSGYEAWVGSKYSLRTGWNQHPRNRKQDANNTASFNETYFGCSWVFRGKTHKHHEVECSPEPTNTIRALYPNLLGHSGKVEKGRPASFASLSAGALTLFMALTSCKEVVLYEVVASDMAYFEPYHYYGTAARDRTTSRSEHIYWGAEHDLWARLANEPISEIKKTGKATITGLSQVKHCPNFAKESPVVFRRPYYLAPLFEPVWLAYDLLRKNRTEQALLFHKYGKQRETGENGIVKGPAQALLYHQLKAREIAMVKPLDVVVIGFSCFFVGCMTYPLLLRSRCALINWRRCFHFLLQRWSC
eukprot:TRINITY_DN3395_c0_g1_i3.p1 TRINITY_DN3395_c0_g1~~TRINITY_DN3395_c0_g1_i3.p1  ORF type:complete len:426 (+),score=33.18 TRINITY_DN3395_c0_g1_i3:70-1347(+)